MTREIYISKGVVSETADYLGIDARTVFPRRRLHL